MNNRFRMAAMEVAIVAAVLLAACAAASPSASNATAASPSPSNAAAASPSPSKAATVPCQVISTEEVAQALHVSAVTFELIEGGYCGYSARGSELLVYGVTTQGGAAAFAQQKSGSGIQVVPGLGDDAIWLPAGVLAIVKGDSEVQITVEDPSLTGAAARLEVAKAVGAIIAAHM